MSETMRGRVAVAGIGETAYYKRGQAPDAEFKLALDAIKTACADAGAGFIDGNRHAVSSPRDPIHWSAETQTAFGVAIAREIKASG